MPSYIRPNTVHDEYHDNLLDRLLIWLFVQKMSQISGFTGKISGYESLVDVSKQIVKGRNAQQQQLVVAQILGSLIPAPILWAIRELFSPTRLVCVLNAWFAAKMFEWLVGPCHVAEAEIALPDGKVRLQPSAVQITKCRYLATSGCVGMCINMCKAPTQEFFTTKFGIPLTMNPNFEDLSCKMIFGQFPDLPSNDDAYRQSCLQQQCPTATAIASPCPQLK